MTLEKMVYLERPVFPGNRDHLVSVEDQGQWGLRVKQVHVDFLATMVHLVVLAKMVDLEALDNLANLDPKVFKVHVVSMDVMAYPVQPVLLVELSTKMLMDPCKTRCKVIMIHHVLPCSFNSIFRQTRRKR